MSLYPDAPFPSTVRGFNISYHDGSNHYSQVVPTSARVHIILGYYELDSLAVSLANGDLKPLTREQFYATYP